jgi:hypothetical protein
MKKTKLEKVIEYIREEMSTAPTNHTGDGVKNFDPVMSHMARRKKSPVSNWIKSAISNDKKRKNIIARFQ